MRRSPLRLFLQMTVPVLIGCVAILEFGLFRFFIVVDNTPLATYDGASDLLKYLPDQRGTRYPDRDRRHPVQYTINHEGWNSTHATYERTRNQRRRVAVIGDSYVEALQVNPDESLSARLESRLGTESAEVYSFGISGAPLSQYLHMARYVARTFHPDVMVIAMVHNDFIESYRPKPGRFTASYLYVTTTDPVLEIGLRPYEASPVAQWMLAHSATLRFGFLVWRTIQDRAQAPAEAVARPARYEANINVAELDAEERRIRQTTDYLFGQFSQLASTSGARVLFVMDAPREAFYAGRAPESLDVFRLNRLARAGVERTGLPFVDLTAAFADDYARNTTRFDFVTDNHWNAYAHDLVARTLVPSVRSMLTQAAGAAR